MPFTSDNLHSNPRRWQLYALMNSLPAAGCCMRPLPPSLPPLQPTEECLRQALQHESPAPMRRRGCGRTTAQINCINFFINVVLNCAINTERLPSPNERRGPHATCVCHCAIYSVKFRYLAVTPENRKEFK